MPNFIRYSPWEDAAQYGQGLGNTLIQALIKVPMEKRELELKAQHEAAMADFYRAHGELYSAQAPMQQGLIGGRVANLNAKTAETQAKVGVDNANIGRINATTNGLIPSQTQKNLSISGLNETRANNIDIQRPSQIAQRGAGTRKMNIESDLMPAQNTAKIGLENAQAQQAGNPLNQLRGIDPGLLDSDRLAQVLGAKAALTSQPSQGLGQTNGLMPQPQYEGNQPIIPASQYHNGGIPPRPDHNIRVQHLKTGELGWATPEASRNPNYRILGVAK